MFQVTRRLTALSLIVCLLLDTSAANGYGGINVARAPDLHAARALMNEQALIPSAVGAQYPRRSYLQLGTRVAVIGVLASALSFLAIQTGHSPKPTVQSQKPAIFAESKKIAAFSDIDRFTEQLEAYYALGWEARADFRETPPSEQALQDYMQSHLDLMKPELYDQLKFAPRDLFDFYTFVLDARSRRMNKPNEVLEALYTRFPTRLVGAMAREAGTLDRRFRDYRQGGLEGRGVAVKSHILDYIAVYKNPETTQVESEVALERILYLLESMRDRAFGRTKFNQGPERLSINRGLVSLLEPDLSETWLGAYVRVFQQTIELERWAGHPNPYTDPARVQKDLAMFDETLATFEQALKQGWRYHLQRGSLSIDEWIDVETYFLQRSFLMLYAMHAEGHLTVRDLAQQLARVSRLSDAWQALLDSHVTVRETDPGREDGWDKMPVLKFSLSNLAFDYSPPEYVKESPRVLETILIDPSMPEDARTLAARALAHHFEDIMNVPDGFKERFFQEISDLLDSPSTSTASRTALEGVMRTLALYQARGINNAHDDPDVERFINLPTRATGLYRLMVYGEEEVYTSTFNGLFDRLLTKMSAEHINGETLLSGVGYDRFRAFVRLSVKFNRLNDFLATLSPSAQETLLIRFIGDIASDNRPVEEAVTIADTFGALQDTVLAARLQSLLRASAARFPASDGSPTARLYRLLDDMFGTHSGNDDAWFQQLARERNLQGFFSWRSDQLADAQGRVVSRYYFYDDEDGRGSYTSFLESFESDPAWRIDRYAQGDTRITSLSGKPVEIWANDPASAKIGNARIDERLRARNGEPKIVVHRGHSFYAPRTIEQLSPRVLIAFLGSCGGYQNVASVLEKSPDAQIFATQGTGTRLVNDRLLKLLFDRIRSGQDLEWRPFWQNAETRLKRVTGFDQYVSPEKNLGVMFLKIYRQTPPTQVSQLALSQLHPLWAMLSLGAILAMVQIPGAAKSSPEIAIRALHKAFREKSFTFDEYAQLRAGLSTERQKRELDQLVALGAVSASFDQDPQSYALLSDIAGLWDSQLPYLFRYRPDLKVEIVPPDRIPDLRERLEASAREGYTKAQSGEAFHQLLSEALRVRSQSLLALAIQLDQSNISRYARRTKLPQLQTITTLTQKLLLLGPPPAESPYKPKGRSLNPKALELLRQALNDAHRDGATWAEIAALAPTDRASVRKIALGLAGATEKSKNKLMPAIEAVHRHVLKIRFVQILRSRFKIKRIEDRLNAKEALALAKSERAQSKNVKRTEGSLSRIDRVNARLVKRHKDSQRWDRAASDLYTDAELDVEDSLWLPVSQTIFTPLDQLFAGARVQTLAPMAHDYDTRAPAIPDRGAQAGRDRSAGKHNPYIGFETMPLSHEQRERASQRNAAKPKEDIDLPVPLTDPSLSSWRTHRRSGIGKVFDHGDARVKLLTKPNGYWHFQIHGPRVPTMVDSGIELYAWPSKPGVSAYLVLLYRNERSPAARVDNSMSIDVPPSSLTRVQWDPELKRLSLVWTDSAWSTLFEQTKEFRETSLRQHLRLEWWIPEADLALRFVSESEMKSERPTQPIQEGLIYQRPFVYWDLGGFAKLDFMFLLGGLAAAVVAAPWLHLWTVVAVFGMVVSQLSSPNAPITLSVPVITRKPHDPDTEKAMQRFLLLTKTVFPPYLQSKLRAIQSQTRAMKTAELAAEALTFTPLTTRDVYDILAQSGLRLSQDGVAVYGRILGGDVQKWNEHYHDSLWRWEVIAELSRREPRINENPYRWFETLSVAPTRKSRALLAAA